MTNHPTWHYVEHLAGMIPSWFLAVGGFVTLIVSHLESGLTRTAASLAAITMIATVSYRAWKLIGKLIRRTDDVDEVIATVPKLVADVKGLHEGQEEMKRSLRNIEDRSRRRRSEDYTQDEP